MRTAFLSLVIVASMAAAVGAEEAANIQSAQNSLEYTLTTLRRSVEKLTKENQELTAANERLRAQLVPLQNELSDLQRDDSRVLEQFNSLEGRYQKKMQGVKSAEQQVAQLKEEEAQVLKTMATTTEQIAAREQSEADLRGEVEKKESEVKAAMEEPVEKGAGDESELVATRDKLREQSRASAVKLQRTRDEWLELQGVIQGGPERLESLKNNRNGLASALDAKQAECAKLAEKIKTEQEVIHNTSVPEKIGPAGMAGLEQEVRDLNEKNRGLEKELRTWQKGDEKNRKLSESEMSEQRKLEAKVKEITERNKELKSERDKLRRQMVNLDKKKAQLEKEVYGNN